jgi:hypothetical protein
MKKIRIIVTPSGDAPKYIRDEWVDIEIPIKVTAIRKECNLPDSWNGGEHQGHYLVMALDAIEALRSAGKLDEAHYWMSTPDEVYYFEAVVCELIDEVHVVFLA